MNNFARLAVLTYRGAFVSWQGPGYVTRIFFQPLLHVLDSRPGRQVRW